MPKKNSVIDYSGDRYANGVNQQQNPADDSRKLSIVDDGTNRM